MRKNTKLYHFLEAGIILAIVVSFVVPGISSGSRLFTENNLSSDTCISVNQLTELMTFYNTVLLDVHDTEETSISGIKGAIAVTLPHLACGSCLQKMLGT